MDRRRSVRPGSWNYGVGKSSVGWHLQSRVDRADMDPYILSAMRSGAQVQKRDPMESPKWKEDFKWRTSGLDWARGTSPIAHTAQSKPAWENERSMVNCES